MACCLTATSHHLNQCCLLISDVQWQSSEAIFQEMSQPLTIKITLKIIHLKLTSNLPGVNVLTDSNPDSKVHGANMGLTWFLSSPSAPHLAPWTLLSGNGVATVLPTPACLAPSSQEYILPYFNYFMDISLSCVTKHTHFETHFLQWKLEYFDSKVVANKSALP